LEFNTVHITGSRSATEINQFTAGYRSFRRDRWGYFTLDLNGYYSPGDLTAHDRTSDFGTSRQGAEANYYYGHFEGERAIRLPFDFYWINKGGYQMASGNLLPSEQLSLGGTYLVRGYPERIAGGEEGWFVTTELHSPLIRWGNITGQRNVPGLVPEGDTLELLAFFDYGSVYPKVLEPGDEPNVNLASVGAGLRLKISQNLNVRFDYGWQLRDALKEYPALPAPLAEHHARAHISATLSY